MKDLKELEDKYKQLGEEIERLKDAKNKKRWRADFEGFYYLVDFTGNIKRILDTYRTQDDNFYKVGNYFKTEEESKESALYHVLNSEYYYSFPWCSDRPEIPDDADWWSVNNLCWWPNNGIVPEKYVYRWKKN